MQKIKNFLKTPMGKKFEKYIWEVLSLTISIIVVFGADMDLKWLVAMTPALNQITKFINTTYLKK